MAETPLSAPAAPATADLRERLPAQPGGAQLLAAVTEIAPVGAFLVGGAVRDLLLGTRPRELDVVVEGGEGPFGQAATRLAGALATRLGAGASVDEHERFGTAIVEWEEERGEGARIDIATARRERYPAPGALPEVEPGSLAEDLERRDFTVNALACALDGSPPAELCAVPGALEDLRARRLRVLHERSFLDDATRLWRLARYRARLGFAVEEHTAQLAATAVAEGAPQTVSLARIGAELRLALGEADPIAALAALDELGLLAALHRRLWFDARLARDALELLSGAESASEPRPRADLLLLAVLLQPMAVDLLEEDVDVEGDMYALLEGMEFRSAEIALVTRAAICADALAEELARAEESSEIYEAASFESLEGVALAGAWDEPSWSDARIAAHRWLTELRNVHLEITGADLLAAGLPEGPEIGRRLEAALCAKLDGELADGREAELAAALQLR
jgi:tRNA nucleotidyltransferase (CCA-adding enzyme)